MAGLIENPNIRPVTTKPSYIARCYHCKIPRSLTGPLKHCGGCQLVSYCSKDCQKDDRPIHKYFCKVFPLVNRNNALYTKEPWEDHIDSLRERAAKLPIKDIIKRDLFFNPRVCHICHESHQECLTDCECAYVAYCSTLCANADIVHKAECRDLAKEEKNYSLHCIQKAFSMSLKFSLAFLSSCDIDINIPWFFDRSSLLIHVVSSKPMLDSYYWEMGLLHNPNLWNLKIVFIIPDKTFDISGPSNKLNWPLCTPCKKENRTITYSIQQMQYHMFFSSSEYTEPDFVAVYGNAREMVPCDKEDIHSDISYRNMTHSQHTILILMDSSKDLLVQGISAVNSAQPIDVLLEPLRNDDRGFTKEVTNEKYFFTCLRRK